MAANLETSTIKNVTKPPPTKGKGTVPVSKLSSLSSYILLSPSFSGSTNGQFKGSSHS